MTDTVQNTPKRKRKRRPPPLPIGDVVNGYRLAAILGRGGMGTVYLGKHEILGREAAVKVLAQNLWDDDEFVSRFFHEAQVANQINHPNIVDILDFVHDIAPKRIAYIMELVDGPTLKQSLKTHRFSLEQTINVSAQLAQALKAAHQAGVIHRDLKPANILIVEGLDSDLSLLPSIKLLDFGIAKFTQGSVGHQTLQGTVLGTPKYMAPEQIGAEPVSPATDIYALGEIFFELATGTRVYNGANNVIMAHKLSGKLPDLSCPDDLACAKKIRRLTAECLVANPERRISIDEFADGLIEIRAELGIDGSVPLTRRRQSRITSDDAAPSMSAGEDHTKEHSQVQSTEDQSAQPHTSLPEPTKRPTLLFASIGVLVLTIIAASALLLSRRDSNPSPQEEPPRIQQPIVKRPLITTPPRQSKEVKLSADPVTVEVIDVRNGNMLGETPYTLQFENDIPIKLVLQAKGYRPLPISVESTDTKNHYKLTPLPAVKSPKTKRRNRSKQRAPKKDTSPMQKQDLPQW